MGTLKIIYNLLICCLYSPLVFYGMYYDLNHYSMLGYLLPLLFLPIFATRFRFLVVGFILSIIVSTYLSVHYFDGIEGAPYFFKPFGYKALVNIEAVLYLLVHLLIFWINTILIKRMNKKH